MANANSGAPYSAAPPQPLLPSEEKQFALLTHLLSIFFGFVPALIFFVLFRERGPFIRNHVVAEWNFQLTALIAQGLGFFVALVGWSTSFASASNGPTPQSGIPTGFIVFLAGYAIMVIVLLIRAIFGVFASVAANKGRFYRYRLAIRFVKE